MTSSLIQNNLESQDFENQTLRSILNISLTEHRYLYSHKINGEVVIPTVFLLEYAVALLQQSPFIEEFENGKLDIQSFSLCNIKSRRFIQVQENIDNKLYIEWSKQEDVYNLSIGCDKLSKGGSVIRADVLALTATLEFTRDNVPTHNKPTDVEPIEISVLHNFRKKSAAIMGSLFATTNFCYEWSPSGYCLDGYSDLKDSLHYYLGSSADITFATPAHGAISGVQYLVFYSYLTNRPAWPADIESMRFYGPVKESLLITQVSRGKDDGHVNVTVWNSSDMSLIVEFKNYQLQEKRN
ncbi:hypothetical protein [Vibrio penaeicida]|uniref:Dehydrogenase (DH) domain-containing protein n=1 Tax=Vibrio penaeicida TaxID=104609 RepID=A0AAV5NXU0_9VIBR|nr:hypothetical protein [Vibrio penaeicida]RTZ21300.1 hypothetical protein EKN09_20130 [Vibrio penaeicida]GLQ75540.1 hypothetical protein GCM10007932_49020 [Vibrio penaeicida]